MPIDCQRSTSGGKGNLGKVKETNPNICAAGIPSQQPDETVADSLQHYLLKDEVDSLICDAKIPPKPPRPLPPLRKPIPPDMRNAGLFCDMADIINPPILTKFRTLTTDLICTPYSSYWKQPLGKPKDPTPMLPEGFDIYGTTFGKPGCVDGGQLYDIICPKVPLPDKTPMAKSCGAQKSRNYCRPAFNPDLTYGYRTNIDKRGMAAKCCVTDDRVKLGTGGRVIVNSVLANFQDITQSRMGTVLTPNDNINEVPNGHSFGKLFRPDNLAECLTNCKIYPVKDEFRKCFKHLNSVRKCLAARFLPTFFRNFYLSLKYLDKEKSGWLPKLVVYNYCATKLIRFDPSLMEPLLNMWGAFDGSRIEYKTFVHVMNFKERTPDIPKIPDLPEDCLDFRTTYTEMVKPNQPPDNSRMAGLPSGRYFDMDYPVTPDGCVRAHRQCLPQESDAKSCLNPSILTLLHVSHREMYAKQEPEVVRQVFEKIGEDLSGEKFDIIWEEAKKAHSQGWVCFETFRQALKKIKDAKPAN